MSQFTEVNIGECRLILGDCRDIMPTLGKFDLLLTDPPYGIGADKVKAHSSIRDNSAWENFGWDNSTPDAEIISAMVSCSKKAMIWGGNYFANNLSAESGWLCWRKPQAESGFSLADIELCWTNLGIAARTKTVGRRDGNEHPTQKPVALMEWCLSFLPKAQTVFDPFMGSGTTGVACANMGRHFTGIEREVKYFDIACKRIDDAYRQQRMFA